MVKILQLLLGKYLDVKGIVQSAIDDLKVAHPDYADALDKLAALVMPKFDEALTDANIQNAIEKALGELASGNPGENPQHPGLAG